MNKAVSLCVMFCAVATWLCLSLAAPWVLSDSSNTFLKSFINQEMLAFLGVVVTITLASTATLHLELNKMEEKAGRRIFYKTRSRIHMSAYSLIGALVLAIALVTGKPLAPASDVATSLLNGFGLLIVLFNVLVLVDVTKAAFSIPPDLPS